MIGLVMFAVALLLLLVGFPVAFTFGGVAVFFGLLAEGPEIFSLMPHRIWSIMNNTILMAIPLFIFMGIVLQKSNLAERLLESMGFLFGEIRGGIAISTILVGALLAASTGVVGASVVAMGVISLPVMLKYNYDKRLASGTICAAPLFSSFSVMCFRSLLATFSRLLSGLGCPSFCSTLPTLSSLR
jgi:TRAP-type mannitol/chloroaromatic compound transport system permease large subunit